ncbi:MAG TPA: site-specific integrase [Ktedonobacteraceae bacterium]
MGKRPGLGYAYIKQLDSLMAIGESRHQAKQAIRETSDEKHWNVSTEKIHSHTTRRVYQQQIMAFVDWVKETHHVNDHAIVAAYADEWASQYLQALIEKGRSPSTLQTVRSALRMVLGRDIASSLELPKRTRGAITRSRLPVKQDAHFQPKNWPEHVLFAQAIGLRRAEMRDLRVGNVTVMPDGTISVHVENGKGGKSRDVTVLAGYEQDILAMVEGREPREHLFERIPKSMDVQSYRRDSAQARYQQLAPGRELPLADAKRIKPTDYDKLAAQEVSESLGHSRRRRSTILNHYLLK